MPSDTVSSPSAESRSSTGYGLFWTGSSVLSMAVIAVSFLYRPESLPGVSVCPFKNATGLPGPGCGLTRAFTAFASGQFGLAWSYHPFVYLLYPLTVFLAVSPVLREAYALDDLLESESVHRFLIGGAIVFVLFGLGRLAWVIHTGHLLPL